MRDNKSKEGGRRRKQAAEQVVAEAQERESKVGPRRQSKTGKPEHPEKNHDGLVLQEKESQDRKAVQAGGAGSRWQLKCRKAKAREGHEASPKKQRRQEAEAAGGGAGRS